MGEEARFKKPRSLAAKIAHWLRRRPLRQIILAVLFLVLVGWIAERLIHAGTLFGYQVVEKSSSLATDKDTPVKTLACDKLTTKEVEEVLGTKVTRIGGIFPDKTEPNFISNCSYKTEGVKARNVTVLVRDATNKAAAQNAFNDVKKRNDYEAVKSLGGEAIFTPVARQINVVTGKRIVSITVSDPTESSSKDNKSVVIELYKKF